VENLQRGEDKTLADSGEGSTSDNRSDASTGRIGGGVMNRVIGLMWRTQSDRRAKNWLRYQHACLLMGGGKIKEKNVPSLKPLSREYGNSVVANDPDGR
jgi:hypothetical protein